MIAIDFLNPDNGLLGIRYENVDMTDTLTGDTQNMFLVEVGFLIFTVSIYINLQEE